MSSSGSTTPSDATEPTADAADPTADDGPEEPGPVAADQPPAAAVEPPAPAESAAVVPEPSPGSSVPREPAERPATAEPDGSAGADAPAAVGAASETESVAESPAGPTAVEQPSDVSGTDVPGTEVSETEAPETEAPETEAPETEAPETGAAEQQAPAEPQAPAGQEGPAAQPATDGGEPPPDGGAPPAAAPPTAGPADAPAGVSGAARHATEPQPGPQPEPEHDEHWAERRAQELVAAVAAGTRWAEERGKAADPEAVENWFDLAAPDLEAAARAQQVAPTVAQPVVAPPRRRGTPGARPAPPPPAPTPRRLAGSTVVKARYSRFGLRVILLSALAVVVVGALVATGVTLLTRSHASPTAAPGIPAPRLPQLGSAKPVLAALSADAPTPNAAALDSSLTPLLSSAALGSVSAEVRDVASGTVLLDDGAARPATPASTAKLLTSTAVLTTLDPADTIPTTVVAGSTPGEVVLVGGGDPTLSRTSPSQVYPGAASIADLADQVTKALPPGTQITRVVVDTSLFTGPTVASGWQPGDAPSSYAAPITAVALDGGRVSPGSDNRSGTPDIDAGRALAAALGAGGAQVVAGQAAPGAKQLGIVHSAPISRLVEQALSQSDNVLAEALARQVAKARHQPVSFEGSAQAVIDAVKSVGVDVTGVQMVDGSGLSRLDQIPAAVLTQLIARAAAGKLGEAADLLSGLPVAGYDGTLAERGDADPATAPGSVRAKTGTLQGVSALAGTVVTADGRLLAFAVLADQVPGSIAAAENALDQIAHALAGCGCR